MSVPYGKRRQGKLKVLLDAANLAAYTIKLTANEKHFPKRYRWNMIGQIVADARDIVRFLEMANAVHADSPAEYQRRLLYQNQASERLQALLTEIDLAYLLFHLGNDQVEYWTGLCYELQQLIRKWRKSDADREKKRIEEAEA